ncbi:MAG: hypothetical protein JXA68_09560 [Ignavibacteriales bacterium]|nr:hypothetical protein [Ignavibacteriales bacterium]
MIYEYALDPEVMANWENFKFFSSHFGFERGRLISRFPNKWEKMIISFCEKNTSLSPINRARIVEYLSNEKLNFKNKFVRNARNYVPNISWINNAKNSHNEKQFHAIISNEDDDNILKVDDIDEHCHLWKVETALPVKRRASEIVKYLKPFFEMMSELLFVDRFFNPEEEKYYKAFRIYFNHIFCLDKDFKRIEIHTGKNQEFDLDIFIDNFVKNFRDVIPENKTVTAYIWDRLYKGENIHPRYLLTEKGGINIDHGFDNGVGDETTDISILSNELHKKRWENFQPGNNTFQLINKIAFTKENNELKYTLA